MRHYHADGCICGGQDGTAEEVILRALRRHLPTLREPDRVSQDEDSAILRWLSPDGKSFVEINANVCGTMWVGSPQRSVMCDRALARNDANVQALQKWFELAGVAMEAR